jgi:hypothetical protein
MRINERDCIKIFPFHWHDCIGTMRADQSLEEIRRFVSPVSGVPDPTVGASIFSPVREWKPNHVSRGMREFIANRGTIIPIGKIIDLASQQIDQRVHRCARDVPAFVGLYDQYRRLPKVFAVAVHYLPIPARQLLLNGIFRTMSSEQCLQNATHHSYDHLITRTGIVSPRTDLSVRGASQVRGCHLIRKPGCDNSRIIQ